MGNVSQYEHDALCDPVSGATLVLSSEGLLGSNGLLYKFADSAHRVVDFIEPTSLTVLDQSNLQMYNSENSTEIYRNFLLWLFETFEENEKDFRANLLTELRLKKGMKVLVTGCGLGEDIPLLMDIIGPEGVLHAQDLSKSMVLAASNLNSYPNLYFSISNANSLPYAANYFDAVFHFGGINLFGDVKKAIAELARVCKLGGRVVFGDEGIAPHLRNTEYANVAITNNGLWASELPLHLLPTNALDIKVRYVLGNCFYLISFSPSDGYPKMNIDVPHKGYRGGSARTRYFGKLEGVTEKTKSKLFEEARRSGVSVHDLLEEIINLRVADRGPSDA